MAIPRGFQSNFNSVSAFKKQVFFDGSKRASAATSNQSLADAARAGFLERFFDQHRQFACRNCRIIFPSRADFSCQRIYVDYTWPVKRYSIWIEPKMLTRLSKMGISKGVKTAQLIRLYLMEGLKRDKG